MICGPALGGLIYAINPVLIGVICLFFFACSITLVTLVQTRGPAPAREPPTFASVLAGIHYIRSRRRLLGVITLDLFVVILGGATALLPIFARDILSVGPIGLGLLRSAPAVGALITAIVLAHHPIERHIGRKMFAVVGIFGVATIVFGLSGSFPVSLVALAILGASDAVSIVIRFSLVQIETPDGKRGTSAQSTTCCSALRTRWMNSSPAGRRMAGGDRRWDWRLGSLLVAVVWMMLFQTCAGWIASSRRSGNERGRDPCPDYRSRGHDRPQAECATGQGRPTQRKKIDRLTLIDVVAPEKPGGFAGTAELSASDLSSPGAAAKAVAAKPDVIFHLAGVVSGEAETDFDKGYRVNPMERARCSKKSAPPVTNRRSCSLRQLRYMARRFPHRLTMNFSSLRSHHTERKRRSASCCSPTTLGAIFSTVSVSGCRRFASVRQTKRGRVRLLFRDHPRTVAGQEALLPVSESVRHTMQARAPRSGFSFMLPG